MGPNPTCHLREGRLGHTDSRGVYIRTTRRRNYKKTAICDSRRQALAESSSASTWTLETISRMKKE